MVIALMAALFCTTVSGLLVYGVANHAGPLASLMSAATRNEDTELEEVHEFFANLTLALVVMHLAGVGLASYTHKENLVRAMITGKKERR